MPLFNVPQLPEWADPKQASLMDPWWKRAARNAAQLVGLDNPESQIMSIAPGAMAAEMGAGGLAGWWRGRGGPQQLHLPGMEPRPQPAPPPVKAGKWTVKPKAAPAPAPTPPPPPPPNGPLFPPGTPSDPATLPMDRASVTRRALAQGYPDPFDPSNWKYHQTNVNDAALMEQQGPRTVPASTMEAENRGSYSDLRLPHSFLGKDTPGDIFVDPSGAPLRVPPAFEQYPGQPYSDRLGRTHQMRFVSRAQNPVSFADDDAIRTFLSQDPEYRSLKEQAMQALDLAAHTQRLLDEAAAAGPVPPHVAMNARSVIEQLDEAGGRLAEQARTAATRFFQERGIDYAILERDVGRLAGQETAPVRAHIFTRPEQIRSPYARFDPALRDFPGMLKSAAPFAVGAGGLGASQLPSWVYTPHGAEPSVGEPPPVRPPEY